MDASGPDPCCYPGAGVFENRLGLRDQAEFEALITAQRGEEPLPRGTLGYAHYRAIHHHLFQEVSWLKTLENRFGRVLAADPMAGNKFDWMWVELGVEDERR